MRKWIHRVVKWYLVRVGGAFHTGPYGYMGRYIVLMDESEYHWSKERVHLQRDTPRVIADQLFEWLEQYSPLQKWWDAQNGRSTGEDYPYTYFRKLAKKRLRELIRAHIRAGEQEGEG